MSFREWITSVAINSSIAGSFSQAARLSKKDKSAKAKRISAAKAKRISANYDLCRTIAEIGLSVSDDCYNNEDVIEGEDVAEKMSEESSE